MKQKIEAILAGVPHKVTKIGPYWQITVGEHGGARENGAALATDLLGKYRKAIGEAKPVEVEKVVYQTDPDILEELQRLRTGQAEAAKATMMANLEKLEAADAKLKERPPEPEPEPEPQPAPEGVTETLLEAGLYQSDPPEKVNEVLLRKLNEAKQCHYIALEHGGSFNGGNSVYWEQKAERYQTGVDWNRGRMAETL